MTRPARPGDLAWLIARRPENQGLIVRVGPPVVDGQLFHCCRLGFPIYWRGGANGFVVTSQGRPVILRAEFDLPGLPLHMMTLGWRADKLIPILDEPGEDETLSWNKLPTPIKELT